MAKSSAFLQKAVEAKELRDSRRSGVNRGPFGFAQGRLFDFAGPIASLFGPTTLRMTSVLGS
jgi:hypothetical protein